MKYKYGGSENHHLLATLPKWYLDGLPKHKKHKINIKKSDYSDNVFEIIRPYLLPIW